MELKPIRTGDPAISRGVTYDAAEIAAAEQGQKVLRNTYLLLALTMVPTVIGAFIGMATAGVIIAHPIIGTFVMLGAVIGLQFGIAANRNSALGILLLLLMTGLLGWWLGPILNFALEMKGWSATRRSAPARSSSPWGSSRPPRSAISASWASSCSSA